MARNWRWLFRYLDYLGLLDPAWSLATAFLTPDWNGLNQHLRWRHRRLFPYGVGRILAVCFHPIRA